MFSPALPEHVYQSCFSGGAGDWSASLSCPSLKFENLWDTHMMKNWNPSVLLQEPLPGDRLFFPSPRYVSLRLRYIRADKPKTNSLIHICLRIKYIRFISILKTTTGSFPTDTFLFLLRIRLRLPHVWLFVPPGSRGQGEEELPTEEEVSV